MKIEGEGILLRVFIGESDRFDDLPLYEAIMLKAKESGLAGVTILRGVAGFGANSRIHTSKVLRLSEDLPMIIEIVDKPEKVEAFIPTLDGMVKEGLITREKVEIIAYRHNGDKAK